MPARFLFGCFENDVWLQLKYPILFARFEISQERQPFFLFGKKCQMTLYLQKTAQWGH